MKQLTNKDLYKISDNFMEKLNRVFEETKAELTELSQKRLADYKEKAIIGAAKNAITKDGDSKTLEKRQKGIKTASDKMEYGVDGERERADRGDRYQKKAKPVKESSDDVKTDVDGRGHYKVNYVFPDKKKIGNDRFETKGEAIKFANALKKKGYHNVSIGEEIEDDASAIDEMKLSTSPVERAIYQRLTATGKMNNLLRKHGLDKVMDAIRNEADWAGDVEEIGSSDVSIWVNRVLKDLKEENLEEAVSQKKFELVNFDPVKKTYRIKSLIDFQTPIGPVKVGQIGGRVTSEKNLSQKGKAWISTMAGAYEDSRVVDDAVVSGLASVYGKATIGGKALISNQAAIYGECQISGSAIVQDNVKIFGRAKVYGNAMIYGKANVFDNAEIYENAMVYGEARIYGKARVFGSADIYGKARVFENASVFESAVVKDNAKVYGSAHVSGSEQVTGNMEIHGDTMINDGPGSKGHMMGKHHAKEEIETNESVTTPMSTEHIGIYKIVVDRDNKITVTDTKTKETKVMDSKFVDDVMENDRFWKMPVIKQVSTVKSWFEKGGS